MQRSAEEQAERARLLGEYGYDSDPLDEDGNPIPPEEGVDGEGAVREGAGLLREGGVNVDVRCVPLVYWRLAKEELVNFSTSLRVTLYCKLENEKTTLAPAGEILAPELTFSDKSSTIYIFGKKVRVVSGLILVLC